MDTKTLVGLAAATLGGIALGQKLAAREQKVKKAAPTPEPVTPEPTPLPAPEAKSPEIQNSGYTGPRVVACQVAGQKTVGGKPFPLVLGPAEAVGSQNLVDLVEYVDNNRQQLMKTVAEHGVILFRGFKVSCDAEFASVINASGLAPMPYVGGAAVRTVKCGDFVFTANESPASQPIPFHHEMAQVPQPPSHLFFYGARVAATGGATPIILSNEVYKFMAANHPEVAKKMEDVGVRYVRVMPEEDDATSAIGRSWKSTFLCKTREEAEAKMREVKTEWEWLENGDLKTVTAPVKGVGESPSGEKTFFNSVIAAFTGWVDSRNDPKKAVRFGDDSAIDPLALASIAAFMEKEKVTIGWQKGDVMFVDNRVAMHSRQTYTGKRSVLASVLRGVREEKKTSVMNDFVLKSSDKIPQLGLGMWKVPKDRCASLVEEAVDAGWRHFDLACDYGNEKEVGDGLSAVMKAGKVKREELWLTSKLWNTYHKAEHVKPALMRTLKDLGVDYLDLYLIHFPIAQKFVPFETRYPPEWFYDPDALQPQMELVDVPTIETWRAMEELVKEGLVKNIGICNFGTSQIRDLLTQAEIKPAVLQVEMHPQNAQNNLVRFCREQSITMTAFSALGSNSYVELGGATVEQSLMKHPTICAIAKAHSKSPAQVMLRWAAQRGTTVVAKTTKKERLTENLEIFNFALSGGEMEAINSLDEGKRFNDPGDFCEGAFGTFCPIYE